MFAIALLIIAVVVGLIGALPALTIDVDAVVTSSAFEYLRAACYFIPVNTVRTILTIILILWIIRATVAFVKMLWDMLPVA